MYANVSPPVMKLIKVILISLVVYLLAFGLAMAQDQLTLPLSRPGQPGTLSVELVRGSITVQGYLGQEVIIQTDAPGEGHESSTPGGLRRLTGQPLDLEATEDDNQVRVKVRIPSKQTRLMVQVPTNFSVRARTVNNGRLRIKDVAGEVEATNVNGDIYLEGLSGSAVANTVNGRLEIRFDGVTPDTPMAFTSLNGDVDVTFPEDTPMTVKMKTLNGEVYTDFDLTIGPSNGDASDPRKIYRVRMNKEITGDINGGGPVVRLKNHNGNIFLRKQ